MRKTFRRKTFKRKIGRRKTLSKKNRITRITRITRNKKMSGGYTIHTKMTTDGREYKEVEFTNDEIENIKNKEREIRAANGYRVVYSTEILEQLFPDMPDNAKNSANYQIQVALGRVYSGP